MMSDMQHFRNSPILSWLMSMSFNAHSAPFI